VELFNFNMFNMAVVRYLGFDRKRVLTSLRLTETDNLSAVIFQHNGLMRDCVIGDSTKVHGSVFRGNNVLPV